MPKYTVTFEAVIHFTNCGPLTKEDEMTFEHDGNKKSAKQHFIDNLSCGIDDTKYVNDDYIDNIKSTTFKVLDIDED